MSDAETSYSELLVDSKYIHWLMGGLLSKRTPWRPGPFCIMLTTLDLRRKQTWKGSSNASWKNELTSSFRRVRSHSETACSWAGREEHTVQPLFSATKGLRRHAEVCVVPEERTGAWKAGTYKPQCCPPEGSTYISLFCLTEPVVATSTDWARKVRKL